MRGFESHSPSQFRSVAQLAPQRTVRVREAAGSNPATPIFAANAGGTTSWTDARLYAAIVSSFLVAARASEALPEARQFTKLEVVSSILTARF